MKLFKIALSGLFILSSCSHNGQNDPVSKPDSSKLTQKNNLSLPDDDLLLLKEHGPQILKKIHETTPISIDEVIFLQQLGFTSDILIRLISHTGSRFQLTTGDVLRLQAEGVPFKVINYMIRA
jgi:hypothetical protein